MNVRANCLLGLGLGLLAVGCSSVPLTGRKQLSLIPNSSMMGMSFQEYDTFKKENKVNTNPEHVATVRRVGVRIQQAVGEYMNANGMGDQVSDYQWEFNVVDDPAQNAWAMPGGKVMVYSGIFEVAKDDTGLAVVMGHEIAHAVARHGNERMSQGLLAQFGGVALSTAMSQSPAQTQQLWQTVYGVGAQYGVLLPYGRTQELEADHLGLIFMAMAGYDPNQAIPFWERMEAANKGQAPPEFLSTHPASSTRMRKMRELMPEVLMYYRR